MNSQRPMIYQGEVYHKRFSPKVNAFKYKVFYLKFSLANLKPLKNIFFSINHFNLFSFYFKDHAYRDGQNNLLLWAKSILEKNNIKFEGELYLQTFPRVLGFGFNPVSFWLLKNQEQMTTAVIAEVNNTFGETNTYVISLKDKETYIKNKILHVSPFNNVIGHYEFKFDFQAEQDFISIRYFLDNKILIHTQITGKPLAYSAINLLKMFFKLPFQSFKIIFLIHYQALKIFLLKVPFVGAKPKIIQTE